MSDPRIIDCEEALRQLFNYLDLELSGESQREMQQHLERCRTCFSRLEFEKRLKTHVGELRSESVPAELQQRIRTILTRFND